MRVPLEDMVRCLLSWEPVYVSVIPFHWSEWRRPWVIVSYTTFGRNLAREVDISGVSRTAGLPNSSDSRTLGLEV